MTFSCLDSSSQAILKLRQSTTGRFVTLTESDMHLISCNPGHVWINEEIKETQGWHSVKQMSFIVDTKGLGIWAIFPISECIEIVFKRLLLYIRELA